MRDMTDTMYNSRMTPFVPHVRGTDLVIEHIERYWCPTIVSTISPASRRFDSRKTDDPTSFSDQRTEYGTENTLPAFAREQLEPRGLRCTIVLGDAQDGNQFPDQGAEDGRSRHSQRTATALPEEQLQLVREYLAAGKP